MKGWEWMLMVALVLIVHLIPVVLVVWAILCAVDRVVEGG